MRLFVAFEVPDEVKDYVYGLQRQLNDPRLAKVKWVFKKNLHLTLKFIGEVSGKKMEEIREALREVRMDAFTLALSSAGMFPNSARPRVLWLGLEPEEAAMRLQQKVDEALLQLVPGSQQFRAHLTIGRVKLLKKKKDFVEKLRQLEVEDLAFEVKGFKLMSSQLDKDGPKYSVIEKYYLD